MCVTNQNEGYEMVFVCFMMLSVTFLLKSDFMLVY